MKKIIIGLMVFFNFGITISNHEIRLSVGNKMYAQQGEIWCNTNSGGNGADPSWWNTYTSWIQIRRDEVISSLGELYENQIPGYQQIGSYMEYRWGQMNLIPYIETYYNGYGYYYFETPSIYGGPYRAGRMMNCSNGTTTYIDCAYLEHNTNASGIAGRSNEIAYLDECDECVGGNTGLPPCSSPLYYISLKNGDTTKYYDGDTITVDPSSNYWIKLGLKLYNAHGVTPAGVSWGSTSNTFWDWPWDIGDSYDVVINTPGDYTVNVYDGGLLSYSTISTNYLHVANRDTVKPTPIPCDTPAIERGNTATNLLNQLATSPELIRTRDSAQSKHETSFSTYDSAGTTKVYPGSFAIGDSMRVSSYPRDTITGANHKNINSLWHLHQRGADPFPDPADLFSLMNHRTLVNPAIYNRHLNHSFIVCGDTLIDLAIVVYDTLLALQYINLNPKDSVINFADTLGPMYSPTYKGRRTINVPRFNISMGKDFKNAEDALLTAHYPEVLAKTYAGIYMMQRYNMGLKTLIKVGGVFKELKIDVTHRANGTIRAIKVKICQ